MNICDIKFAAFLVYMTFAHFNLKNVSFLDTENIDNINFAVQAIPYSVKYIHLLHRRTGHKHVITSLYSVCIFLKHCYSKH